MFSSAGIPRSDRTIQRWCEDGHLRCSKYPTETGSKYFVEVESARERLEAIRQVQEATAADKHRRVAAYRDMSSVTAGTQNENEEPPSSNDEQRRRDITDDGKGATFNERHSRNTTPDSDVASLSATGGIMEVMVEQLHAKDDQIKEKDRQLKARDDEIGRLHEARETDRGYFFGMLSKLEQAMGLPSELPPNVPTEIKSAEKIAPIGSDERPGDNVDQ